MALNRLQKLAGVSAVALSVAVAASDSWSASYTVGSNNPFTVNATATVNNTISVTETAPLAFGDVGALYDAADTATMVMDPTGAVTDDAIGPALLVHSTGTGTPGTVDITGAFPSTNLTVDMGNAVDLSCALCTGTPANLILQDVVTDLATPGSLAGATAAQGTTDGTGALTINYGMTISTTTVGNPYTDGVYAGTFDFFFSY